MKLRTVRDETEKTGVDCSNPRRRQFVEIQPFSVDPDTGEILNSTGEVALKEVAPVNQDEMIQSYFESTDLHTVLTRIRKGSGEELPVNDGTGSFIDLTQMPRNRMELDRYLKEKKNKAVNPSSVETAPVASPTVSDDELDKKIKTYLDRKFGAGAPAASVDEKKEDVK